MRRRTGGGLLALLSATLTLVLLAGIVGIGGYVLLSHPSTPVPTAWNPLKPLDWRDRLTPLTRWKLERSADGAACFAALDTLGVEYTRLDDLTTDTPGCFINDRLRLTKVGQASLAPVETRCSSALRLAMWEHHGVQGASERSFAERVTRLHHQSSYSCRRIRTTSGEGQRMSSHATASAIDISGVSLSDGTRIDLISGWDDPATGPFFRAIRDSACRFFRTTLGPDFNALHADHFHLQATGRGTCR